ncbi:MAG TPA: pyridoxamine 5'-phosphate oxidase family protein [Actinobacteria bacterium]|nr:pyridoxamine 5'-phosphate oxidase family protein [Actinomycetota bacterium]
MELLSDHDCVRLLERSLVGHLAVISLGEPYVTPLSYVFSSGSVGFRTGPGRRLEAVSASPRVCFEVSEFEPATGNWASVIVYGTAREEGDPHRAATVVSELLDKYQLITDPLASPARVPGGSQVVTTIEVESITGRTAGSLLTVRSRPGRL